VPPVLYGDCPSGGVIADIVARILDEQKEIAHVRKTDSVQTDERS